MTNRITTRMVVRRESGWHTTPLVVKLNDQVGRLQVAVAGPTVSRVQAAIDVNAGGTPQYFYGATSESPLMLRGLYIYNNSGITSTIRMGIMSIPTGSPGSANAVFLYDYALSTGLNWIWRGMLALVERYLYACVDQGTSTVLTLEFETLTAA